MTSIAWRLGCGRQPQAGHGCPLVLIALHSGHVVRPGASCLLRAA